MENLNLKVQRTLTGLKNNLGKIITYFSRLRIGFPDNNILISSQDYGHPTMFDRDFVFSNEK